MIQRSRGRYGSSAGDSEGFSMIEVIISTMLLGVVLVGLTTSSAASASRMIRADSELRAWATVQQVLDSLTTAAAVGLITDGGDSTRGFPITWTVTQPIPTLTQISLVHQPNRSPVSDTLIVQLSDVWSPQ